MAAVTAAALSQQEALGPTDTVTAVRSLSYSVVPAVLKAGVIVAVSQIMTAKHGDVKAMFPKLWQAARRKCY